tara:strand:+ start:482 stop:901 length:420 start_codon:yes stop_codon:yes gene_type:complete
MWYYKDMLFEETPENYQGFVYEITELQTNKKYIGKKNFWKPKILPKNSKRKRRIRTRVESDWRSYFGSSGILIEKVNEYGEKGFTRVILKLCKTKGEMSYYEAKLQFEKNVLLSDEYYNEFIGCKIHAKHLKGIEDGSE